MSATLPTAAFLAGCDEPMRGALLRAHACRLYVEAAQALARRAGAPSNSDDLEAHDRMTLAGRHRKSVRRRLRRLFDRADEFGIYVGQPAKPKSPAPQLAVAWHLAAVKADELDVLLAGLE